LLTKQVEEAKTKAEIEKIMQERLAEKEKELSSFKQQMQMEKIDKSILSVASSSRAVNPDQVVALLKSEIQLADDGRTEIVDNNGNIRYNSKGQPLTIEERVKEFLDSNPHFRQGSLSGTGSQSAIGGNSQKPRTIGDLDLNNPC
jgi:polyribonucleotide nucleotidyltransferase